MGYAQLTENQRYQIYALKKAGHKQIRIASLINVDKSTISRELKRNTGLRGYRPRQAHMLSQYRKTVKYKSRISSESWEDIDRLIQEDLSPEQTSVWLKKNTDTKVSHEWIYVHIRQDKQNGGTLHTHLRCKKKRRKKYGSNSLQGQLVNRVSIEDRPAIVDSKARIGDWEIDTIIGGSHKQAIVTLTERYTRFTLMAKVKRRTASQVAKVTIEMLKPYMSNLHTITADNGKEFAAHEEISRVLKADFYFAHPYSSYERGLNENTNGLIRQYFPKGSDFQGITSEDTGKVINKLNNRPRKCLGFQTPNQLFLWH
jgi:IS30 family transposase